MLIVVSILHLVWSVKNSHQWYSPTPGLWIATLRRMVLDYPSLTTRNLVAGLFVRIP